MFSVRKFISVAAAVCLMAVSSVAMAATDISDGVIRAEGISGLGQSFAVQRIAARVIAERNLAEQIHGVQIDGNTTVENAIVTSDVINVKVSGLIKGAREVSVAQDEYGYVHVIMEMPIYGASNSLAAVTMPQIPQQEFLPPSDIIPVDKITEVSTTITDIEGESGTKPSINTNQATMGNLYGATGQYTGLIVDCSGMGLQTAMAPAIVTDGRKIVYGLEKFSREQVINRGYVGYSKSVTEGVGRAGSNPMVIKAESIERFCNPVISKEEAVKILAENQMNGFLSTGNVVFVK